MKKQDLPKLSIYDIKRLTEKTSPYFFSRDTLKFFNQKMSDFKVTRYFEMGLYFIIAPMRNERGETIGYTTRYFNPKTNELELTKNEY
jgi:hypothetical protein